jgi:hypothetical protein
LRPLVRCLVLLALAGPGSASAGSVAYVFTAELTRVDDFGLTVDANVGDVVEGTLRYDPDAPSPVVTEFTLELGDDLYSYDQPTGVGSNIGIVQDESFDFLGFALNDDDPNGAATGLARLNGTPIASQFALDFQDFDGSTLTSDDLPGVLPPLASWDTANLFLIYAFSLAEQGGIRADLTSLTLIPEPGTGVLLAGGLIALGARRRPRRC